MKQRRPDSPSIFLAAAMAMAGAAMLLCPLIGQNTEMNQSAAEYDDLRVQLKSEEQEQAMDMPEHEKTDAGKQKHSAPNVRCGGFSKHNASAAGIA